LQINPQLLYSFDDATTGNPQQPGTSGASLASALLGMPHSLAGNQARPSRINFKIPIWGAYLQDEWKLRPNVTVTLGLRFDHAGRPTLYAGMNNGPDMRTGNWEVGGGVMPPPCNQVRIAPCIPGNGLQDVPFSSHIVLARDPVRWRAPDWSDWGPRASIAWRLVPKTVLRAGYGLFYDALPAQSQAYQNMLNQWPYSNGVNTIINDVGQPRRSLHDLQADFPMPLPAPSPWTTATWFSAPGRQDARSLQWNVEIQRQMTDNLMLSAGYVGSTNRRLDVGGLANTAMSPGPGTPDQVNQRRLYPWMGAFFYDDSVGRSNYNALHVTLNHRYSQGLQFLLSYTWSKSIDVGSSGWFNAENGPGGSSAYQNYYNIEASRSVSSFDVPHFLSFSSVWQLPFGKNARRGRWLLTGWQANTIVQLRSGQPFNLSVAGDVANVGNPISWWNYSRPNLVGDPEPVKVTAERFYNPEAFAIPQFQYGNFGRNVLRTDKLANVDFSLFRTFRFGFENHHSIQLRCEAFNVLNIINWGVPGTLIGQPDAGKITILNAPPRELQLGFRVNF
jgi:hypothetical protein